MKSFLTAFVAILLITACSNPGKGPESEEARFMASYADSLTREIDVAYELGYLNGFSVAIANEQGVLYEKGFGLADVESSIPYTEHSLQNIASISKTFIGVALLKARELGLLSLDDDVNDYLPFEVVNPFHPGVPITFRHLATHTSTIVDTDYYEYSYIYLDTLTRAFPDTVLSLAAYLEKILWEDGEWYAPEGFLENAPGEWFEYSNLGAGLAALGLESATGLSFPEFTRKYIFEPLDMSSSGWSFGDIDTSMHATLYADPETPITPYYLITYPDGGLRTSASDMGKYLSELLRGSAGEGRLLSDEGYTTLFTPQLDDSHFGERDSTSTLNDEYNSGIFMGLSGPGRIGHTGGDPGVISLMFFDPRSLTGFYFMTNTEVNSQEAYEEIMKVLEVLQKFIDPD